MRPRSGARRMRRSPTACARARSTSSPASRSSSARALRCAARSRRTASPRRSSSARPGTGKTTLARIIAASTQSVFEELSAVSSGKADVQAVIGRARERLGAQGQRTVLFIDEIHRFNKAQQDALLPVVESGLVTLIGATTENPFHSIIGALVSRCRLYEFEGHSRGRPPGRARARSGRAGRAVRRRARCSPRSPRRPRATRATRSRRSSSRTSTRSRAASGAVAERGRRGGGAAPSGALRPRRRPPLRHDLGVHQERAGERPRRGALLPRRDARGRRGPGLHRPADRDPRERGHRQRRPARARAGRRPARAWSSWSACPSAATRSRRRPPISRWRPSRTPRRPRSRAAREAARAHATARPPAALRDAQLPRRAASWAAASATATRTTRRGRSWPTITCPPELAGSRFYEPTEHGLEAKLAERLRELRRLRAGDSRTRR